ncbi:MAG: hypothetical protein KJZ83_15855 [Burkholderiaceae bacterium]|nr:hypothetical protein [Burkholderiaceae bacterium]
MLADYISAAWLDRLVVREKRASSRARAARRIVPVLYHSLDGRPESCTRSSGLLAGLCRRSPEIALGPLIESGEAFLREVGRLVPPGSRERLIRNATVDFSTHRVAVFGVRVPSLSTVRIAGVHEIDGRIEVSACVERFPAQAGRGWAAGLIWCALPRSDVPLRVLPFGQRH